MTPLQNNFGVIMLALDNGQPRQIAPAGNSAGLLDFRETTLTRQYQHKLEIAENRLHVVAGFADGVKQPGMPLSTFCAMPPMAPDRQAGVSTPVLTCRNGSVMPFLAMPLRRLTGLERENLETEHQDLLEERERLAVGLLSDRRELLKSMKKEPPGPEEKEVSATNAVRRIQTEAERQEETQQLEEIIAEEVEARWCWSLPK